MQPEANLATSALLLERGSGRLLAIWPVTEDGAEGGNAVLDEHNSTFKDAALLTEFGRTLVAAQFATETTPT